MLGAKKAAFRGLDQERRKLRTEVQKLSEQKNAEHLNLCFLERRRVSIEKEVKNTEKHLTDLQRKISTLDAENNVMEMIKSQMKTEVQSLELRKRKVNMSSWF